MLKKMIGLLVLVLLLFSCGRQNMALENSISNQHFEVFYDTNGKVAAEAVLEILENSYQRIVNDLKCNDFNTKVYLYPDQKTFHKEIDRPNAPNWLVGIGSFDTIRMVSPKQHGPQKDYDEMLLIAVHEFAHCAVHQLVYEHKGDAWVSESDWDVRWLYEGIALYESNQFRHPLMFDYISRGNFPSLVKTRKNAETPTEVYNLGYTFIEYIDDTWGFDKVRELLIELGDVKSVLGMEVEELEKGWHGFIRQRYLTNP